MLIHTVTEPSYIPGLVPLPRLENINILKKYDTWKHMNI